MRLTHKGLEFEISQDASIPFLGRDMSKHNKDHPHEHYETHHFSTPEGKAGLVAIQVMEDAKVLWIHEIDVDEDILGLRNGYGSKFLHYTLSQIEKFPNLNDYTVRLNGVTPDGKEFFGYYGALQGINYQELMTKLEEKI